MNQADGTDWRDAYLQIAERLMVAAPSARPVLAVSNACVDQVFHVDAGRLSRLATAGRVADDEVAAELVAQVLVRITNGKGGELLTRWPDGPGWITAVLGPPGPISARRHRSPGILGAGHRRRGQRLGTG